MIHPPGIIRCGMYMCMNGFGSYDRLEACWSCRSLGRFLTSDGNCPLVSFLLLRAVNDRTGVCNQFMEFTGLVEVADGIH
jgi:hypothetical protein